MGSTLLELGISVEVLEELNRATEKFANFNSGHEGYAVIKEELDELWEAVRVKGKTVLDQRAEAIQVAAMAIRYVRDLCPSPYPEDHGLPSSAASVETV